MGLTSGVPGVSLNVADKSLLFRRESNAIYCLQGKTKRGRVHEPKFVQTRQEFIREFGDVLTTSDFPFFCMRLLDAGAKLWISRVGHYTTITDKTTLAGTKATVTAGTNPDTSVWNAEAVGSGYDGTTVTISLAKSGDSTKVDITVTAKDSDVSNTCYDVPTTPSASYISDVLNKTLVYVQCASSTNLVAQVGTYVLTGGAQDLSAVVDADYVGDSGAKNGWYSFGNVTNAFRIANIDRPSPTVDAGLLTYIRTRKGGDMRVHIGTPVGATVSGAQDYRMGTGVYSHTPINDWLVSLWAGQLYVNDPVDYQREFGMQGLVDFLCNRAITDNQFGPWISTAGPKRGVINQTNKGVKTPNFIAPENKTSWDTAYELGVNAIVQTEQDGPVIWGNRTLLRDTRKVLSKENIADLAMYVKRGLEPLTRTELFEPNDPAMWRQIYRNVLPFIQDLENNRAIKPGEGRNWFWIGDQDAANASDAQFNQQNDIDQGIYKCRFVFVGVAATEYISIDVVVTDSNSLATIVNVN